MQIFSDKFTAVYSSYRHLFHNKKSTTIFIKLEVRWRGRREEGGGRNTHSGTSPHTPGPVVEPFLPQLCWAGGAGELAGGAAPPTPQAHGLCPCLATRGRPRNQDITATCCLFTELEATWISEEAEHEGSRSCCAAGRRGRGPQKPRTSGKGSL